MTDTMNEVKQDEKEFFVCFSENLLKFSADSFMSISARDKIVLYASMFG